MPYPFRTRTLRTALIAAMALGLAACASPRERCVNEATAELRTIDRLIAETEANIARGYALVREPGTRTTLEFCYNPPGEPFVFCPRTEATVRERPVAIDRAAERRKLASLRERRAELVIETRARLAACNAQFPA